LGANDRFPWRQTVAAFHCGPADRQTNNNTSEINLGY